MKQNPHPRLSLIPGSKYCMWKIISKISWHWYINAVNNFLDIIYCPSFCLKWHCRDSGEKLTLLDPVTRASLNLLSGAQQSRLFTWGWWQSPASTVSFQIDIREMNNVQKINQSVICETRFTQTECCSCKWRDIVSSMNKSFLMSWYAERVK